MRSETGKQSGNLRWGAPETGDANHEARRGGKESEQLRPQRVVRQRWDRQGIEEVLQAEDWELLLTEPPLEGKRESDYVLNPPKLQLRRDVD